MKVITIKAHPYHSKRKPGEVYECKERDFRLINRMGWAKPYLEPVPEPVVELVEPDPEPVEAEEFIEETAPKKRTYRRRDLRAE